MLTTILQYGLLIIGALVVIYPILYALGISFMGAGEAGSYPPHIIPQHFVTGNFGVAMDSAPLGRFMINSFIVSIIVTLAQLVTASLAAYAFAFLEFFYWPTKNCIAIILKLHS